MLQETPTRGKTRPRDFSRGSGWSRRSKGLGQEAAAYQSAETDQASPQQAQSAGLGNRRGPGRALCEAGIRSAVRARGGAEVDSHAGKLTRAQARGSEHERNRIGADYAMRLSLDVGEIEGKVPKHADILGCLEMLEIQARTCTRRETANTGEH